MEQKQTDTSSIDLDQADGWKTFVKAPENNVFEQLKRFQMVFPTLPDIVRQEFENSLAETLEMEVDRERAAQEWGVSADEITDDDVKLWRRLPGQHVHDAACGL